MGTKEYQITTTFPKQNAELDLRKLFIATY